MTTTAIDPACTTLPLERYPGIHPLALDLVRKEKKAVGFFEERFVLTPSPRDRRTLSDAIAESNLGWGADVRDDLDAWARGEATAIVAGQQVGFGGGPLYTLVKLASLVRMRRAARDHGQRIIAFFWMATEDHDFEEVSRLSLQLGGSVHHLRSALSTKDRFPVGPLDVPSDLRDAVLAATRLEEEGWLAPGLSMRDSFARLIHSVTRGEVVLVDSLLPELRSYGSELFTRIAGKLDQVQEGIARRSAVLEEAGYPAQVKPACEGQYTLFYELGDNGARLPLDSAGRLAELAAQSPERISTAALTRPLLQDFVFEPESFVGGPSEVAYYAQLGEVYRLLSIPQPHVKLRAHCLVAPDRILRSAQRHGISPAEWLDEPDSILARMERVRTAELSGKIRELHADLDRELDSVREQILQADESMTRSLNRTIRRLHYHLDVLERRGTRVIARKDRERAAAVERLSEVLRPNGTMQDRVVGWLSYWLLWGDRLFDAIVPHAQPASETFDIIGIS